MTKSITYINEFFNFGQLHCPALFLKKRENNVTVLWN